MCYSWRFDRDLLRVVILLQGSPLVEPSCRRLQRREQKFQEHRQRREVTTSLESVPLFSSMYFHFEVLYFRSGLRPSILGVVLNFSIVPI